MNRTPVTRVRAARGFTLLELIIVAVVAMVIFAFLIRWVMNLGTISDNGLSQSQAARSTLSVDVALGADTSQATACGNFLTPIRAFDPKVLELYVSSTFADVEETHLVRYEVADGTLTRAEYRISPDDPTCRGTGAGFGKRTLAEGLRAETVFSATENGAAVQTCSTTADPITPLEFETTGTACSADAVDVTLRVEPQGKDGGRDVLNRSYPLTQRGGAL
jgi:type II secretory pathway pseudopilin PulG